MNRILTENISRWYVVVNPTFMIGQAETLEGLDEAIDKGLFEVKLRLKDNGSENINAICTDYVGKAYKFDKNKKFVKFVVTLPMKNRST